MRATDRQVGGDHYRRWKVQPIEFFIANQIPFHKATVIKRIMRYDLPTGKGLEDLEKIKHEIDLIIELEGWTMAAKKKAKGKAPKKSMTPVVTGKKKGKKK